MFTEETPSEPIDKLAGRARGDWASDPRSVQALFGHGSLTPGQRDLPLVLRADPGRGGSDNSAAGDPPGGDEVSPDESRRRWKQPLPGIGSVVGGAAEDYPEPGESPPLPATLGMFVRPKGDAGGFGFVTVGHGLLPDQSLSATATPAARCLQPADTLGGWAARKGSGITDVIGAAVSHVPVPAAPNDMLGDAVWCTAGHDLGRAWDEAVTAGRKPGTVSATLGVYSARCRRPGHHAGTVRTLKLAAGTALPSPDSITALVRQSLGGTTDLKRLRGATPGGKAHRIRIEVVPDDLRGDTVLVWVTADFGVIDAVADPAAVRIGMAVLKSGYSTGLTTGAVVAEMTMVGFRFSDTARVPPASVKSLFIVRGDGKTRFADYGDSGSVVCATAGDGRLVAFGMVLGVIDLAGVGRLALVQPLKPLLDRLGLLAAL